MHDAEKRIRNQQGRSRVAACDARGKLRGKYVEAESTVHGDPDSPQFERAFETLIDRYGWQARLVLLGSRLGGTYPHRCALAVRLKE